MAARSPEHGRRQPSLRLPDARPPRVGPPVGPPLPTAGRAPRPRLRPARVGVSRRMHGDAAGGDDRLDLAGRSGLRRVLVLRDVGHGDVGLALARSRGRSPRRHAAVRRRGAPRDRRAVPRDAPVRAGSPRRDGATPRRARSPRVPRRALRPRARDRGPRRRHRGRSSPRTCGAGAGRRSMPRAGKASSRCARSRRNSAEFLGRLAPPGPLGWSGHAGTLRRAPPDEPLPASPESSRP